MVWHSLARRRFILRVVLPYQSKKPFRNGLTEEVAVTGADEMAGGWG
jgi:hypothetical protein